MKVECLIRLGTKVDSVFVTPADCPFRTYLNHTADLFLLMAFATAHRRLGLSLDSNRIGVCLTGNEEGKRLAESSPVANVVGIDDNHERNGIGGPVWSGRLNQPPTPSSPASLLLNWA